MKLGWIGFLGTIAVTATLTSACWMSLHPWVGPATPASAPGQPQQSGIPTRHLGSGLGGGPAARAVNEQLIIPVVGVRREDLVDTFRDARSEGRVHDAIDIMAPLGTPVIAAAPGRVEKLYLSAAGGNTVYVRSHDGGTIYYYAHLDHYAPGLAEGAELAQGAAVGSVGYSGNASPDAPHLHFAVLRTSPDRKYYEAATAENPYPLLIRR